MVNHSTFHIATTYYSSTQIICDLLLTFNSFIYFTYFCLHFLLPRKIIEKSTIHAFIKNLLRCNNVNTYRLCVVHTHLLNKKNCYNFFYFNSFQKHTFSSLLAKLLIKTVVNFTFLSRLFRITR